MEKYIIFFLDKIQKLLIYYIYSLKSHNVLLMQKEGKRIYSDKKQSCMFFFLNRGKRQSRKMLKAEHLAKVIYRTIIK